MCFRYIKMCKTRSMIEKKKTRSLMHVYRNDKIDLHDPRTSRAHVPLTTRKKNISPMWIRRNEYFCNVAQIALKANSSNFWYLDSGYSKHMTSSRLLLWRKEDVSPLVMNPKRES